MSTRSIGLSYGFHTILDLDSAVSRARLALTSAKTDQTLTELSTALRYKFLRQGNISDFYESVTSIAGVPRPTFEDIGTATSTPSPHLFPFEVHWMRLQPWLEAQGYILRSRFRPDWSPAWDSMTAAPSRAVDRFPADRRSIEAVRREDGATVWLKLCPAAGAELEISAFFASTSARADTRNHCCPLLDFLRPPLIDSEELWIIVSPLLRDTLDPLPRTVGELTAILLELAEGLNFIHGNNVAHRDICLNNTMMDAAHLIPGGWASFMPKYRADPDGLIYPIRPKSRSRVPVRYYFIDFGQSSIFPSFEDRRLVVGDVAQNTAAPELSKTIPYDPFALDIRMFGDIIRRSQSDFAGLAFLKPVVERLVADVPSERADAREMLEILKKTVAARSRRQQLLPLRPRNASNIWAWMCYPVRLLLGPW